MDLKLFAFLMPLMFLMIVIELIRRGKLTFKYAVGWIILSVAGIVFIIFDDWLFGLARWAGFELPSNFIFFTLLAFFVFLSLLLTTFICQQDGRNAVMAQRIGMLELEIEQLRERVGDAK